MPTFDPATVRQAVAEFTPLRPQKFGDLIPAKDVIIELRQRRALYRAIATLLTQHCLPTSKTAIVPVATARTGYKPKWLIGTLPGSPKTFYSKSP